jgi:CBS domain-containing protein
MTIDQFLSLKISETIFMHPYEELTAELSIKEVLDYMISRKTSCVVISSEGKPVGVFSEKDLARRYESFNPSHNISEYMTKNPICITESYTLGEALGIMMARGIRHIVITKNELVQSIISIRDITNKLMDNISEEEAEKYLINIKDKL